MFERELDDENIGQHLQTRQKTPNTQRITDPTKSPFEVKKFNEKMKQIEIKKETEYKLVHLENNRDKIHRELERSQLDVEETHAMRDIERLTKKKKSFKEGKLAKTLVIEGAKKLKTVATPSQKVAAGPGDTGLSQ